MKFALWLAVAISALIWLTNSGNPRPQLTEEQCNLEAIEIAGQVYANQISGRQDYFEGVDLQAYNDKGCKKNTLDAAIKSMY